MVIASSYGGQGSTFKSRGARGTPFAPAALQDGDVLGAFGLTGYATTGFGDFSAGFGAIAAENWTDTAQGSAVGFLTTPLGAVEPQVYMAILPSGNVGVGTPAGSNGIPTAADKLQVFGDIRVGTTCTNGCLKDFGGTGLVGTCASDRRFKKDITPFGSVLRPLTALQPSRRGRRRPRRLAISGRTA